MRGTLRTAGVIQAQATRRRLDDGTRLLPGRLRTEYDYTRSGPPSGGLAGSGPTVVAAMPSSSHREATPYPDAHTPLVGAGNLSELVGRVGLSGPAAGLGWYEVSWRDDPPCVLCRHAKNRASLGELRVRLWRYGIWSVWRSKAHGYL